MSEKTRIPLYNEFSNEKKARKMNEGVNELEKSKAIEPEALNTEAVNLLTERLKDEYYAHFFYRNAANWCRDTNYKKAAAFFEAEAASELDHVKGLQDYITDFNVIPVIPTPVVAHTFTSLVDIINGAYVIELELMKAYNETSVKLHVTDMTTYDFLQEYRKIQKDAVVEYSDLLNAAKLVDTNNRIDVLYFEQTYF